MAQVWRIFNNSDSLTSRFLKSIYFKDTDILEAEVGKNRLWKSLMWGRDLLSKRIRYRIGNGNSVKMFYDAWTPKEISFKPTCNTPESINMKVCLILFFLRVVGILKNLKKMFLVQIMKLLKAFLLTYI